MRSKKSRFCGDGGDRAADASRADDEDLHRVERSVLLEQLEHVVVREPALQPALAADDVRRCPERVQHGLLGRLDGRREELVQTPSSSTPSRRRGREREEDLAAAVVRDRAGSREAEAGAAGDPLELRAGRAAASVATTAMQLPAGSGGDSPGSSRPTGTPATCSWRAEPKLASTRTPSGAA